MASSAESIPADASLRAALEARVRTGAEVGFSYVVVSRTGILFEWTGGRLDAAQPDAVTSESVFLSASTTKVLTALAVLRLVDQGRASLNDPLSRFLTAPSYAARITLRQLLNHTSGVPNPLPLKWIHLEREHSTFSEPAALRQALSENSELAADPGQRYLYSNLAYWLLGEVIRIASGSNYADFVKQELLHPLGIVEGELSFEGGPLVRRARGHARRFSPLGLLLPLVTERKVRDRPHGPWLRFEHVHMNGLAYGGAFASARAYGKILVDLLSASSRVLSDDGRRALFAEQFDSGGWRVPSVLGFQRGEFHNHTFFEKPGGGPGFCSNVRIYPGLDLGTVFLSNRMRVSESEIRSLSDELDGHLLPHSEVFKN
jgi:D-alanyl-D-alanine carboxypeptidase